MNLDSLSNDMARKLIDALNKNTEAINKNNGSSSNSAAGCHSFNNGSGGSHCK